MHRARMSTRSRPAVISSLGAMSMFPLTASTQTPVATPVATGSKEDWLSIAREMRARIDTHFLVDDDNQLYREFSPHIPSARRYAFLWPFSALLSGSTALARAAADKDAYNDVTQLLTTLDAYFDADSEPPGYDSYPVNYGGGDKFYDDNQWLGMDYVHAWRELGDEALLEKAVEIWQFSISGWTDEDMGGGIYWKQNDFTTKNTCSNGPAAVLAMMLYQETGEGEYLDWAVRIMDWLDVLFDPATGVYNDHLRDDGSIETTKWTYNAGTPMHASALLYQETGEQHWLTRAQEIAESTMRHFASETDDGVHRFPPTPWFNAVLQRGFCALYDVVGDGDRQYIDAIPNRLLRAWNSNRDSQGFIEPDWTLEGPLEGPKGLIDQSAIVEIAATAAIYGEEPGD